MSIYPSQRLFDLLETSNVETPFLAVDLDVVIQRYMSLRATFPNIDVYFAVKALPTLPVLRALLSVGCNFDVASPGEIDMCLNAGADPSALSYGNTVKAPKAIEYAYSCGVRRYAFDSQGELDKIGRYAPGSEVFCRVLTSNAGADWPLSRKFGCEQEMAVDLIVNAYESGLIPKGVAFHVGSQQRNPSQWDAALELAAQVCEDLSNKGIDLPVINLGGGLPAHYQSNIPALNEYGTAIESSIAKHFGADRPSFMIEPGRYIVGDAGILRSTVLLVSRKSQMDDLRWVYLDAGRFNALAETEDEAIRYRIKTSKDRVSGRQAGPVVLAGPTCDSIDVIYEKYQYQLPLDLEIGDTVDFLSAGAYTVCYATAGFNGFGPPAIYYTGESIEPS